MPNGNIWPNTALLQDISLQTMSDLELDLSRSFKVKSNLNGAAGLPIYDFLLVSNTVSYLSPFRSNSHSKYFSYLLSCH